MCCQARCALDSKVITRASRKISTIASGSGMSSSASITTSPIAARITSMASCSAFIASLENTCLRSERFSSRVWADTSVSKRSSRAIALSGLIAASWSAITDRICLSRPVWRRPALPALRTSRFSPPSATADNTSVASVTCHEISSDNTR